MKLLLTGVCGFVGSTLAKALISEDWVDAIVGIDNFSRAGSEHNRLCLTKLGIDVVSGDIRCASDIDSLPKCDRVIDASANPSVLAGIDGKTSSRQLVEHNLIGTINLLEYCKRHDAGFCLLSTSRVYSISGLAELEMEVVNGGFQPVRDQVFPTGVSSDGVNELYGTLPPVSLYGSTKVASEHLALEYGATYEFPVWINRCGVMAGAGQFGHPSQGIFSFWIHSFREGRPLKYIGFGELGLQVRDCLHPKDLVGLLRKQFVNPSWVMFSSNLRHTDLNLPTKGHQIFNIAGGTENSMSLAQLSAWCTDRYPDSSTIKSLPSMTPTPHALQALKEPSRAFDIPWLVLDCSRSKQIWGWSPSTTIGATLEDIAKHADTHPQWLESCL